MIFLDKETRQDIANDNSKIENVNVKLCHQMSGAKQSQMGIVTEFVEHKKGVEKQLGGNSQNSETRCLLKISAYWMTSHIPQAKIALLGLER
jgi:hypothetical protein